MTALSLTSSVRTPTGVCDLYTTETDFVMTGATGIARLDRASTDLRRLEAHWNGFLHNNGGRLVLNADELAYIEKVVRGNALRDAVVKDQGGFTEVDRAVYPRASLRAREIELRACDEHDDVVDIIYTRRPRLKDVARLAEMPGVVSVSLAAGYDLVHDPFDANSDYDPQVSYVDMVVWQTGVAVGVRNRDKQQPA